MQKERILFFCLYFYVINDLQEQRKYGKILYDFYTNKGKENMNDLLLYLADRYDLVVGDKFELFYRGIIRSMNPYQYYIYINCEKGTPYPRYFTYTPSLDEVGDYELTVTLYDDFGKVYDEAKTILHVVNPTKPSKKVNILCLGDSLTFNGVWPYEGYRRFTKEGGSPKGLGFSDSIQLIGTMKKDDIGYEGYGGWQWRHFCLDEAVSSKSSIWIQCNHHFDENDQHSIWKSDGLLWVLESIEEGRLKFKRGSNNYSCLPTVGKVLEHVEGGLHHETINIDSFEFEKGNPFYDKETEGPNFKKYCEKNQFEGIDYLYVLLTWNGQYIPFNHDFSMHEKYITWLISALRKDYPQAKVRILGIQSPSINGGIAANYGASGYYHNVLGDLTTAYNYDKFLEEFANRKEYKDFCRYIDTKAQFDVEYNMPSTTLSVNARSEKTEVIGTNGVHPTMEGYLQIGDVFYRALCADMKEE